MKLGELVAAAADERVTARYVRFLIAEGVVPPPRGGRAHADYGADHLAAIRRYLGLRELGLTAVRARAVVAGDADDEIALPLAPGVTLLVRPHALDRLPDAATIARRLALLASPTSKKE